MAKKQVNFKLPPDLIEALDAKALEENTNRTELVIQGIRYILGLSEAQGSSVDNRIHSRIDSLEARLHQIETHRVEGDIHNRLHALEHETQNLSDRLAQIQQQESTKTTEHRTQPEVVSSVNKSTKLTLTELAKRLSVDRSNLAKARKSKTAIDLAVYTKERDPQGTAWQFDEAEEVFRPV